MGQETREWGAQGPGLLSPSLRGRAVQAHRMEWFQKTQMGLVRSSVSSSRNCTVTGLSRARGRSSSLSWTLMLTTGVLMMGRLGTLTWGRQVHNHHGSCVTGAHPSSLQEAPNPWSCSLSQHSSTQPESLPSPVVPLVCSPQAALVWVIVMGQQPSQGAVDDDTGHSLTLAQLRVPSLTPCQLLWLLGLSRARGPDHGGRFWKRNTVHSAGPCTDASAWPLTSPLGPH